jgi:riboflavin kinase / FMN adenylyltransferase
MRILRGSGTLPRDVQGAVVALGNFDGVHRGHQALLAEAKARADEAGLPLAVLVFEPYPREFFRPDDEPFRLTQLPAKARLLEAQGVDALIVLGFDSALANMLAQDFVLDLLVRDLAASHVVVGADFRFGKGRAGDTVMLSYMGEMEGFGVTVFRPQAAGTRLLGHPWTIEGMVREGDKRGRTIGYPTANLTLDGLLQPAFGVYAVRVQAGDGRLHHGMANFGRRPTFALPTPLFEVHLFDFAGDLYGQTLQVELVAFLRPEQKFTGIDALREQLERDAVAARSKLAA